MRHHFPVREYAAAGGVVVADSAKHVLVLRRAERLGPSDCAEIRLPKGHIESDESPQQAALREVGEEAGLAPLGMLRDLGDQVVEFDWQGQHIIRHERYFLLTTLPRTESGEPEEQFERRWLPWDDALDQLTFEAEREWVRRAQRVWVERLEDIPEQYSQQADNYSQMKE